MKAHPSLEVAIKDNSYLTADDVRLIRESADISITEAWKLLFRLSKKRYQERRDNV